MYFTRAGWVCASLRREGREAAKETIMHHRLITRPRLAGLVLAVALSALLSASALAGHPKAGGSYAGFTWAGYRGRISRRSASKFR